MPTLGPRTTRHVVSLGTLALAATIIIARPHLSTAAAWILFVIVIGLASVATLAYWRAIGEVARDAQKTAWLWGSLFGLIGAVMMATIPAVFPFIGAIIDWVDTNPGVVNASFVTGMMWVLAAQLIGFAIYWTGWWIAKR